MPIHPVILGNGRAGEAIAKALASLNVLQPELQLQSPHYLKRGESVLAGGATPADVLFCIANPHALHAPAILDAERAGVAAVLCEKPSCATVEQARQLKGVRVKSAVLHGYRMAWGPQTLRQLIAGGELGDVFCVEGRYWQSSTAEKALQDVAVSPSNWKNDVALSGPSDVLLDLGTHMVDCLNFLYGSLPENMAGWKSFSNAEAKHRDSHVWMELAYPGGKRAQASVSKNVHGATNRFEVTVMGSRGSASWAFLQPDEIWLGAGKNLRRLTRAESGLGSRQAPYHAMGWLEGYIEIARRLIDDAFFGKPSAYPTVKENAALIEQLLNVEWKG